MTDYDYDAAFERCEGSISAISTLIFLVTEMISRDADNLSSHDYGIDRLASPHIEQLLEINDQNKRVFAELLRKPSYDRPLVPAEFVRSEVMIELEAMQRKLSVIQRRIGAAGYADELAKQSATDWAMPRAKAAPADAVSAPLTDDDVRRVVDRMQSHAESAALAEHRQAR